MMKIYILLSFLAMQCINDSSQALIQDYCWKDYDGVAPSDALKHGLDKNGRPVYVGQVLFEGKLVPGQIYENDKIYFEWRKQELSATENVKILCSTHADKFVWVATRHDQVALLTDRLLVKGGFEAGYSTYIGRSESNGVTQVGKVICSTDDCFGLYTTSGGRVQEHPDFQVLTYKS